MMSDEAARHYSRYMENVALATDIDQLLATHRGWNCVVRFYAVLHLINAYLIRQRTFDPMVGYRNACGS